MPVTPISHPLALQRLRDASARDGRIDVLAAAIAIASHVHPTLQPAKIHASFDRYVQDVQHIAGKDNPPHRALQHALFVRHGFAGNQQQYNDPQNSYIDTVLHRRIGLPILLSLVYVETARRSGYTAHGIALPGHFIAAFDIDNNAGRRIYIDAFNRGKELSADACRRAVLATGIAWHDEYLHPADPAAWALRILSNIRSTYSQMSDLANTAAVLEQMLILDPTHPTAGKELQAAYQHLDNQIARNN